MTRPPTKRLPVGRAKENIPTIEPGELSASSNELMTLKEVAALIRVHRVTVRKMVMRGELPAFRIGVFWRIRRVHVERLIARGNRKDSDK